MVKSIYLSKNLLIEDTTDFSPHLYFFFYTWSSLTAFEIPVIPKSGKRENF